MEWLTTSTILRDLREQAPEAAATNAWRHLVERFRTPIVHFGRQAGLSPVDAEDAAQETLVAFVKAYREGQYQRDRGRLSQWLFGIAWRQVQQQRRRVARSPVTPGGTSLWADVPDAESSPLAVAEWDQQWERTLLEACLARVREEVEPDTYRAFEAATRDDRPASEIAAGLNLPVKTVYNAKHRVLQRLRELREELETVNPVRAGGLQGENLRR
jgi:RNA polymerase sigma-70 factor (ECF subfamily)